MPNLCDEYEFMMDTVVPFLRRQWDTIDLPEQLSACRDGRLTLDELYLAYEDALKEERTTDAYILNEIIMRYSPLCRSHSDGYWSGEETALGISEADVSVYLQKVSPSYRERAGVPKPFKWL
jgi:hypothetical protein